MKKITTLAALTLSVLFIFAGCDFFNKNDGSEDAETKLPTTGIELDKKAEEALKQLDSYTESLFISAKMTINDIDFSVVSTSVSQVINRQSDTYLSSIENTLTSTYDSKTTSINFSTGFQDGYIYRNCQVNLNRSQMKSPISKKDYLAFLDELEEKEKKKLGDATPKASELMRLEDGGYKAVLRDFDQKYVNNYFRSLIGEDLQLDTEVNSLTVTITTTEDYVYKSIELEFGFIDSEDAKNTVNSLSVFCDYRNINSTVISKYDISKHKETSDLTAIYRIEDAINEAKKADSGNCTLIYDYENIYDKSQNVRQEYSLNFNRKDGLAYLCTIVSGASTKVISYDDNKLNVKNYREGDLYGESSADSTDDIQENTVHTIIDFVGFNQYLISNIQLSEDEENAYVIELFANDISNAKTENKNILYEFKITVVEGKLAKYCYKNTYKDTNSPKIEITATYDWSTK